MDYQRQSNGWMTFLEHYWLVVIAVSAVLASQLLSFSGLTGTPWIWCYAVALLISGVGVSQIFFSKLPLYRQRRFFTFGSGAVPEGRRSVYIWGYRCVVFAVALLLCLFLSRP
ncbi:MAG TPA: hypothetical protein VN673_12065 [Clostridia bacterium]|nr:hypothetical protein [Clostridia bacterium]